VKGPDPTCSFQPVDDNKVRPDANFVVQVSNACGGTIPGEVGYKEQVPGLGPIAYIKDDVEGATILVCRGQSPFEVRVDAETPELRREAVIALARQVLAVP
jgi:hypothetical protein